jgi:hypothetical protein
MAGLLEKTGIVRKQVQRTTIRVPVVELLKDVKEVVFSQ